MSAAKVGTRRFKVGFVALVGRPNVGKSTLVNRLVDAKVSIVSDKPQTTRNRITGIRTTADHQIVFVDTPGIHKPLHTMNDRMVRLALDALEGVDVISVLSDVTESFGGGDAFVLDALKRRARAPVYLLLNKIDLIPKPKLLPLMQAWGERYAFAEVFPVSALTGEGVDAYLDTLVKLLPEGAMSYPEDQLSDVSLRFLAQEIVREKILLNTRAELPFATTVVLEGFDEGDADHAARLEAVIYVEAESQKPILIGRGGAMVKLIGSEARKDLEELLGKRVFLGLRVKVKQGWRDDATLLDRLGLGL